MNEQRVETDEDARGQQYKVLHASDKLEGLLCMTMLRAHPN